jgi:phosphatidate cytidylyltransferase
MMADDRPEAEPDPDDPSPRWATSPADPTEAVRVVSEADEPPLRFGPDETGPLPHWTEPPTGEMAAPLADDDALWARLSDEPSWGEVAADPAPSGSVDAHPPLFEEEPPSGSPAARPSLFGDESAGRPAAAAVTEAAAPPIPGARPITPIRTNARAGAPAGAAAAPGPGGVGDRTARRGPLDDGGPFTAARGTRGRNMPQAIGVGAGLGVAYILLARLGGARGILALVVVILGLAVAELYESQRKAGYAPATFVGLAATIGLPLAGYWRGEGALVVVIFAAVVAVLLWLLTSGTLDSAPMPNASATLLGVVYIGFLGAHGALILRGPDGVGTITTLAVAVVAYDVMGLLVGSAVGRSPLVSWVSPNKTVEGLLGGAAGVLVAVFIVCGPGKLHPWSDRTIHWIQLAVVVAIAAPLGDLVESMLKRSLGVKDMGELLPGHGGVLDRFDAFLFVLPSVYYLGVVLNVPQVR